MALTKVASPMLKDWAYRASMTDTRMVVDKTASHTFDNLLTFKQHGFNAVMVDPAVVADIDTYLSNAEMLDMGVVLEYLTDTPDNTQLSARLYNTGNALLGIDFTPGASAVTFDKFIQGFMIYNNWTTTSF